MRESAPCEDNIFVKVGLYNIPVKFCVCVMSSSVHLSVQVDHSGRIRSDGPHPR